MKFLSVNNNEDSLNQYIQYSKTIWNQIPHGLKQIQDFMVIPELKIPTANIGKCYNLHDASIDSISYNDQSQQLIIQITAVDYDDFTKAIPLKLEYTNVSLQPTLPTQYLNPTNDFWCDIISHEIELKNSGKLIHRLLTIGNIGDAEFKIEFQNFSLNTK